MAPLILVILISTGSFQATIPGKTQTPSPVFPDSAQGLASLTEWASSNLGVAKFNQPPLKICVVGAVPFKESTPFISKPIWESQKPIRSLEPYSATFHYVEVQPGAPAPKPRNLKQAVELCTKVA